MQQYSLLMREGRSKGLRQETPDCIKIWQDLIVSANSFLTQEIDAV